MRIVDIMSDGERVATLTETPDGVVFDPPEQAEMMARVLTRDGSAWVTPKDGAAFLDGVLAWWSELYTYAVERR